MELPNDLNGEIPIEPLLKTIRDRASAASHPLASGTISAPSHPFTPDVVAWAREYAAVWEGHTTTCKQLKAARQILAAVGRG